MTARFSHSQMADIFKGVAQARSNFISTHRRLKDRPEHWFQQQARELAAFEQAAQDYQRASEREKAA